ncbi:MAG: OmpA family protein [Cyclobacteriaceae bacterium]|nr:OmpA family protein [Cyclobacteriaceae bacterium]
MILAEFLEVFFPHCLSGKNLYSSLIKENKIGLLFVLKNYDICILITGQQKLNFMKIRLIFYYSLLLVFLNSGCVTQKKYNELLADKVKLEGELVEQQDSLDLALQRAEELQMQVERLLADTTSLGADLKQTKEELSNLNVEYEQLETFYNNLLNNSGKLNRDLAEQQERLLALKESLENTRRINEELENNLSEREKKVEELENILAKKDEAVNALKKRISDALLNFKESDLTVEMRNGKVYVSLAEQLLFKSGSVVVDPKGQGALGQLAQAVKDQKDINIMVEGHTDNVPISRTSQYMNDNWDLSVMRATSIVRILVKGGISPAQVTAAGKGEFIPISDNDSVEGRQKNRRTEIIITPNLDELFEILGNN